MRSISFVWVGCSGTCFVAVGLFAFDTLISYRWLRAICFYTQLGFISTRDIGFFPVDIRQHLSHISGEFRYRKRRSSRNGNSNGQAAGWKNWLATMKVYSSICAYPYGHYRCIAFAVVIRFSTVIATAPPFSVFILLYHQFTHPLTIVDIHISRIRSFLTGLQPGFPYFLLLSWQNGALGIWEITSLLGAWFTCFWELYGMGKGIVGIVVFVYLYCFVFLLLSLLIWFG